jgi:GTPase involved in cell partitioning and DNA repair
VLNKADLMFEDEAKAAAEQIVAELGWKEPWFLVSALGREGTFPIMSRIMAFFDRQKKTSWKPATRSDAVVVPCKNPASAGFFIFR